MVVCQVSNDAHNHLDLLLRFVVLEKRRRSAALLKAYVHCLLKTSRTVPAAIARVYDSETIAKARGVPARNSSRADLDTGQGGLRVSIIDDLQEG